MIIVSRKPKKKINKRKKYGLCCMWHTSLHQVIAELYEQLTLEHHPGPVLVLGLPLMPRRYLIPSLIETILARRLGSKQS